MERITLCSLLAAVVTFAWVTSQAFAGCGDTWHTGPTTFGPSEAQYYCAPIGNPTNTSKSVQYVVYWLDGHSRPVTVTDWGQNRDLGGLPKICVRCFPEFHQPFFSESADGTAYWDQMTKSVTCDAIGLCLTNPTEHHNRQGHKCSSGGGLCGTFSPTIAGAAWDDPKPSLPISACCSDLDRYTCEYGGGTWDEANCSCLSPIVIDVAGNGFNLTNAAGGVPFDITSDGVPDQISWTSVNSDDAWLTLDRNSNGRIDDGTELFGSSSPQPYLTGSATKNGFRALAMFDNPEYGGNSDGQIDTRDRIFSRLKLWQDRNHNGVSEANELLSLTDSDIRVLELQYHESKREDENGNWFRYRAKVKDARDAQVGRWAFDVFLQRSN